ncbi:MAG: hypothetical protein K0S04_2295 [Herbinix sp.]|jgi:hypothetical protein|nr:hypothetical protein [Herbinix sp.]
MKVNQLALRIGIVIMILMALFYLIFIYVTKLKSPVFLRHCMDVEVPFSDGQTIYSGNFSLNYITDKTDQGSIISINFPEAPELLCSASESNNRSGITFYDSSSPEFGITYGRFSYRTVYIDINYTEPVNWTGEKVVHKANIQLNNGESYTVDVGTIVFYRDQRNSDQYIENSISQSSSDGSGEITYITSSKIKVLSIKSDLLEEAKDFSYFRVNDYDYKDFPPESYEENGIIKVTYQISGFDRSQGTYDYYELRPKLYYQDPEGKEKYYRMVGINHRRFFGDVWDVLSYLIGRGVW